MAPRDHAVAQLKNRLTLPDLAAHPLVTYVFSSTGESSFKAAFEAQGLEPRVVFTARDADVIKTYVRMGMGVGVMASMAYECADSDDLAAIDAKGLFPRVTTWLGFQRDAVLRTYMVDFISLFAPQLTPELIRDAAMLDGQAAVDSFFGGMELPLRSGCE